MINLGYFLLGVAAETVESLRKTGNESSKNKYMKKYQDDTLFSTFIANKKEIHIWKKHHHDMKKGQGAFLSQLMKTYQKNDIKTKLILVSSGKENSSYLEDTYNLSTHVFELKGEESITTSFHHFEQEKKDVFQVSLPTISSVSQEERREVLETLYLLLQSAEQEQTIYLLCLVEGYQDEEILLQDENHIRLVYVKPTPDYETDSLDSRHIHIHIPHAKEENYTDASKELFANVPSFAFHKDYEDYHHFVYYTKESSGVHFMQMQNESE